MRRARNSQLDNSNFLSPGGSFLSPAPNAERIARCACHFARRACRSKRQLEAPAQFNRKSFRYTNRLLNIVDHLRELRHLWRGLKSTQKISSRRRVSNPRRSHQSPNRFAPLQAPPDPPNTYHRYKACMRAPEHGPVILLTAVSSPAWRDPVETSLDCPTLTLS
jgi:hypothetical protein